MTNYTPPPPTPRPPASDLCPPPSDLCPPHPALAPYARQLDHCFETQTLLYHQVQDLLRPKTTPAPLKTDPRPGTSPQPSSQSPASDLRPPDFTLPSIHALTLPTLPTLLPFLPLLLLPTLLNWQKFLLKSAQLAIACQKPQNKATRAGEPQSTDTKPNGDNSQLIALMRKAMFADVDELERSGEIVLPD
jgi:hypothetical protein